MSDSTYDVMLPGKQLFVTWFFYAMMPIIQLIRVKDWAKNSFLFIPLFFAGQLFDFEKIWLLVIGFFSFSLVASSIYIINDYRDIEDDQKHPEKSKRPLASGAVKKNTAIFTCILLLLAGFALSYFANPKLKFLFILGIYFIMNLAYSLGLKNISILDIFILAIGFVLRIKAGSVIAMIQVSEWLIIMVFLLALFMATAKRRDDILLKISMGLDMRKSIKGYNLEFMNTLLSLICAVIIVAYFMYTMSPDIIERLGTYRLYYTCIFVIAGIMRYLQITYVQGKSGSPTKILYKDRFIQLTILLWISSFYAILYLKNINIFN
ncbi:MAG: UbiA prenyltransferase family protein [Chitinophagaceae bacterium]